ncbi:serine hydrolase domain-containing protein [Robertkochia aurantiaca]|uniref:serine hydrolase domain-containing protein n=1 Tax=Robertkochia aurantiaca TaxID=2873700 RepID=UPI001CCB954E|nr:serine hydrolase domain-containing protein [Robertkochia sp. 3YJGBD-33]
MINRTACFTLLVLLFTQIIHSQNQAIDSVFAEWAHSHTPGAALGIYQNGELIYAKGYGMANLEYDIPIDRNTVFRIGSTSKQFTAACIILLSEEGKLNLDDPLSKYFPDFPAYADQITLKNLLHHTSGIRDYLTLADLMGKSSFDHYTDDHIMQWLIRQQGLGFEPGTKFEYSNSGYWLLGMIVEKVSGKNMAEYAKEKIFDPLGMKNTHFHNDHTHIVKNRADGYAPVTADSFKIDMTTLDMIGDGGIYSTVQDFTKWNNAYYDSDVLTSSFWEKMTQRGILTNGDTLDYAGGLFIDEYRGLKTISHGGAFVGYRAEFLRFPEQETGIAIFSNRRDADPTTKAYQVADILLSDQFKIDVAKKDPSAGLTPSDFITDPSQITGYYEALPGVILSVFLQDDLLTAKDLWTGENYTMKAEEDKSFSIENETPISYSFSSPEEGEAQKVYYNQGGWKITLTRIAPVTLTGQELKRFEGYFYSEELESKVRLFVKNGTLYLQRPNKEALMLIPTKPHQFGFAGLNLDFSSDPKKPDTFFLSYPRAKNFRFTRVNSDRPQNGM